MYIAFSRSLILYKLKIYYKVVEFLLIDILYISEIKTHTCALGTYLYICIFIAKISEKTILY